MGTGKEAIQEFMQCPQELLSMEKMVSLKGHLQ